MAATFFIPSSAKKATDPIVTAKQYIEYKKANGHLNEFIPPKVVLICYQESTYNYLLNHTPDLKKHDSFSNLYLLEDGQVGILAGWGMGAPALSVKLEQLIALGVDKFIAVGTAGTLLNRHPIGDFILAPQALAEDGVAHLYLKGKPFAQADTHMRSQWNTFAQNHALPSFHETSTWSFSAIFHETPADVMRVTKLGCDIVEMEAATLYAIGQDKNVQTLSLFVISDSLTLETWTPHLKETAVRDHLNKLAGWALEFCKETAFENAP